MFQLSTYILITMLSAVVILVMGICLVVVSVPREAGLKNYHLARHFLAGAYIVLAGVGLWETFGRSGSGDNQHVVMACTLIAASFQALLFTYSIITLINMRYITALRLSANVVPISVLAVVLVVILITTQHFLPVFYVMLALYCLQLIYYIVLFALEYARYRRRFDNFFAGNEHRRSVWIRNAFYMSACVGVIAVVSLFVSQTLYIIFTVAYTVFYIYFAIKFTNYITLFHRIATVVVQPQNGVPGGNGGAGISEENIRQAVCQWIGCKKFLNPDISLELLARELNTNPTYLSRHVNNIYGQNFRSWINSLRIAEAQKIITGDGSIPLADVGQMVGIPSTSTFYRQFAAVTGMAPTEYRKKSGSSPKADKP